MHSTFTHIEKRREQGHTLHPGNQQISTLLVSEKCTENRVSFNTTYQLLCFTI